MIKSAMVDFLDMPEEFYGRTGGGGGEDHRGKKEPDKKMKRKSKSKTSKEQKIETTKEEKAND